MFPRSLDSILNQFNRVQAQLQAHDARMEKQIQRHAERINEHEGHKARKQIEQNRARRIAGKIQDLVA